MATIIKDEDLHKQMNALVSDLQEKNSVIVVVIAVVDKELLFLLYL